MSFQKYNVPDHCSQSENSRGCQKYTSCRWTAAFMFCLLRICQTSLRQNIGMALVCMSERPTGDTNNNATKFSHINDTSSYDLVSTAGVHNGSEIGSDCSGNREFEWTATFEGVIFSSYYYGYLMAPLISSYLDRMVGAKRLVGGAVGVGALVNFLTPSATRLHPYLLVALRTLAGFTNGLVDPPVQSLWAAWAPKPEVAHLTAVEYTGVSLGGIFTFLLSGLLCQIPMDNGWPFVFYFYGSTSAVWLIFWVLLIFNTPQEHPRISEEELEYIKENTHYSRGTKGKIHPPWCRILRSGPVWAIVAATATFTWVYSWILAYLPMYMQDILKYTITENAVLSSLPFVGKFVTGLLCGYLADRLLATRLSVAANRKLFQFIGCTGCAVCTIVIGFQDYSSRGLAVALLVLVVSFQNVTTVAFRINALDIAPRYAAFILGLSSTVAVALSMTAPFVTSAFVKEKLREEWQIMFYIVAALSVAGALLFILLGSATLQDWATTSGSDEEEVPETNGVHPIPETTSPDADAFLNTDKLYVQKDLSASDSFLNGSRPRVVISGPRDTDHISGSVESRRRHLQKSAALAVRELDADSQWSSNLSLTGS